MQIRTNIQMDEIIQTISAVKPQIREQYRVKEVSLFGSFVRGEDKPDSDIDLLIDFDNDADLFDLIGVADFLENKLYRKVDVISKKGLRKELRDMVFREAIQI